MEKAVLNTVLGMGTVFIVLIFISYIISLLQHVNKIGAKKQTAEEPQQTAPAPVVEEPEDEEDGLVVRSIRKVGRQNNWK